jgi:hypothetical protein
MKLVFTTLILLNLGCGQNGNQTLIEKGRDGANGTQVTIVQFCKGTTEYPSTFEELGFCIDNKIYAVYSANNGFLTEVPVGGYSSNAVGSNCVFTVLPGCVIQN